MKQAEEYPSERSGERTGPSPVHQEEAERSKPLPRVPGTVGFTASQNLGGRRAGWGTGALISPFPDFRHFPDWSWLLQSGSF